MIKRILADVQCCICKGHGCYDCGNKGVIREWIDFEDVLDEIKEHINEDNDTENEIQSPG